MRTTLTIDDDVPAAQTGCGLGNAVSQLARRGFRPFAPTRPDGDRTVFAFPSDAAPITSEDVYRSLDEWP